MNKVEIIQGIKQRLGKTSLSDRTIDAYVDATMPEDGKVEEVYFDAAKKLLSALDGQFSHDVAQQVNEFKSSNKTIDKDKKQDENDITLLSELKSLREEMKSIKDEMKLTKDVTSKEKLIAGVISKHADLKVRNKALWEDSVKAVEFKDGYTEESIFADAKKLYEANMTKYFGDGAEPYSATKDTTAEKDANKKLRENFLKKLQDEGKIPSETKKD